MIRAAEAMSEDLKAINYYVTGEESEVLMQQGDPATEAITDNTFKDRLVRSTPDLQQIQKACDRICTRSNGHVYQSFGCSFWPSSALIDCCNMPSEGGG